MGWGVVAGTFPWRSGIMLGNGPVSSSVLLRQDSCHREFFNVSAQASTSSLIPETAVAWCVCKLAGQALSKKPLLGAP